MDSNNLTKKERHEVDVDVEEEGEYVVERVQQRLKPELPPARKDDDDHKNEKHTAFFPSQYHADNSSILGYLSSASSRQSEDNDDDDNTQRILQSIESLPRPQQQRQQQQGPGAYNQTPFRNPERRHTFHRDQLLHSTTPTTTDPPPPSPSDSIKDTDATTIGTNYCNTTQPAENVDSDDTASPRQRRISMEETTTNEPNNNNMDFGLLVEAQAVSSRHFDLGIAEPANNLQEMEKERDVQKKRFNRALLGGGLMGLIVILGIIVAIVFGLNASSTTAAVAVAAANNSSSVASLSPTMAPTLFIELPQATVDSILTDDQSPQAKAYAWLANDPNRGNFSTDRLLQRYALATFYYSLEGNNWLRNGTTPSKSSTAITERHQHGGGRPPPNGNGFDGGGPPPSMGNPPQQYEWLSYDDNIHECDWYNMNYIAKGPRKETCNDLKEYTHMDFTDNNLRGTLPAELALLTSMESLVLHVNEIRGTLPKELFTGWTNMNEIMLARNKLSGTLPSLVGLWAENIKKLSLQMNSFTGSLPSELWQLTNLHILHLHENAWKTACVSTDIGKMHRLGSLEFQNICVTSSLPTEIVKATSLFRLQITSEVAWTIPSQLAQLTNLAYIMFEGANLNGTIPKELELLSNLELLNLNENPQLVGSIPASLGSLVSTALNQTPGCPPKQPHIGPRPPPGDLDLEMVFLKGTGLTGTLPPEWCNSLNVLCFDCSNSTNLCGCGCPCPT